MTNERKDLPNDDDLGFAYDAPGVEVRRRVATELLGHTLRRVSYVLLEYHADKHGDHRGLRVVTEPTELQDPDWRFPGIHSVDVGIEIQLDNGAEYFATWDSPGRIESLRFARGDLEGWTGTRWDVTPEEPWSLLRTSAISRFDLNYEPWGSEGGFWCPTMTVVGEGVTVTIELADCDAFGNPELAADNLTVTYSLEM